MTEDVVELILESIEQPVELRAEFADTLLQKLTRQLEGEVSRVEVPPSFGRRRVPWRPRVSRRPLVAMAATLAVAIAALSVLSVIRASTAEAVIANAIHQFGDVPPFSATMEYNLNPDGDPSMPDVPRGATATIRLDYGGPSAVRETVVSMTPGVKALGGPGSFIVWDGRRVGTFNAASNEFTRLEPGPGFNPIGAVTYNAPFPNWSDICRRGGSQVFPDTSVAGRPARHVRCGDYRGGFWDLWVDADTGLMLKITGLLGNDEFKLGTSSQGGFEVTSIRYRPTFAPGLFTVTPPAGAHDITFRPPHVDPFHAVYDYRQTHTDNSLPSTETFEVWYLDDEHWRSTLRGVSGPSDANGGPGSFTVRQGDTTSSFNATRDTYQSGPALQTIPMATAHLVPGYDAGLKDFGQCPVVGATRIVGRLALHRQCTEDGAVDELWLDVASGLILRRVANWGGVSVTSLDSSPVFPSDIFAFSPPPGARPLAEAESDPFTHTSLRKGALAPDWSAQTLDGAKVDVSGMRGKPLLVMTFADYCQPGDPVCDVLPQLQRIYLERKSTTGVVMVDLGGTSDAMRRIVSAEGYTFPIVVDPPTESQPAVARAWGLQIWPFYVLLDASGHVVDARQGPQSYEQLSALLAEVPR